MNAIHSESANYSNTRIPNSPTQRRYHYGLRAMGYGGTLVPITWFSDYGRHVNSSVQQVTDYICIIEMNDAMRKHVADRIRFLRRVTRN